MAVAVGVAVTSTDVPVGAELAVGAALGAAVTVSVAAGLGARTETFDVGVTVIGAKAGITVPVYDRIAPLLLFAIAK